MAMLLRWMIKKDLPDVLEIERNSFDWCWRESDFKDLLRQRFAGSMVCEIDDEIAGYMIYELHPSHLEIVNFAVCPYFRRLGVGTRMVKLLKDKLKQQARTGIVLQVRETNLPAQLFFRSLGFRACLVVRDYYLETGEDAYRFRYALGVEADPTNRIADLCGEGW